MDTETQLLCALRRIARLERALAELAQRAVVVE